MSLWMNTSWGRELLVPNVEKRDKGEKKVHFGIFECSNIKYPWKFGSETGPKLYLENHESCPVSFRLHPVIAKLYQLRFYFRYFFRNHAMKNISPHTWSMYPSVSPLAPSNLRSLGSHLFWTGHLDWRILPFSPYLLPCSKDDRTDPGGTARHTRGWSFQIS